MRSGLEVFVDGGLESLKGKRLGLCCNHTAVDRRLNHALDLMVEAGAPPVRLFAPEHGVHATVQDMVGLEDEGGAAGARARAEVVSLYGEGPESLRPAPETLADLDAVLFDIQDIGARYYTYQATLGYLMEVAATTGTRVIVLDRPNPITGAAVEGNVVQPGFESFVSAFPLAVRHGMTMGELAGFFRDDLGIAADLEVVRCEGWERGQWLDETDLPWVYPSPNMPTLECAAIYPGLCLIEGTNLSEGRGTTRPFHLVGAPWLDPDRAARACRDAAQRAGLKGVAFRAATFLPQFQKHAGEVCGGVEIFVTDRRAMEPFLLGLAVTQALRGVDPERFAWRTKTYEFVDDPIAIDLLCGSSDARRHIEAGGDLRDLEAAWQPELAAWKERRAAHLLY